MYQRYVDDTNKVVIPPPLGSVLQQDGVLLIDEQRRIQDILKPRDQEVADLLVDVANTISSMIRMEADMCSKHQVKLTI